MHQKDNMDHPYWAFELKMMGPCEMQDGALTGCLLGPSIGQVQVEPDQNSIIAAQLWFGSVSIGSNSAIHIYM